MTRNDEAVLLGHLESLRDEMRIEQACLSGNPDARAVQVSNIERLSAVHNAIRAMMQRAGCAIGEVPLLERDGQRRLLPTQPRWRPPAARDLTGAEAYVADTSQWPGAKVVGRVTAWREARAFYEGLPLALGVAFPRWWSSGGEARYDAVIEDARALAKAWRACGAPRDQRPNFDKFWFWVALRQQTR